MVALVQLAFSSWIVLLGVAQNMGREKNWGGDHCWIQMKVHLCTCKLFLSQHTRFGTFNIGMFNSFDSFANI